MVRSWPRTYRSFVSRHSRRKPRTLSGRPLPREYPLDNAHADPQRLRDPTFAHPSGCKLANLGLDVGIDSRAAKCPSFRSSASEARPHSLLDHRPLELGKDPEHAEHGFPRWGLSAKVRQAVATELVASEVATVSPATECAAVEAAASLVVSLVREHRRDIAGQRSLASVLKAQLGGAIGSRELLEEMIAEEFADRDQVDRAATASSTNFNSRSLSGGTGMRQGPTLRPVLSLPALATGLNGRVHSRRLIGCSFFQTFSALP